MTAKGCDFELCSGGEEDEYLEEVEVHSPTDSSEDSVEVKISPICLRNKRKCAEPRKVQDAFTAPLKKRMCFKAKKESSSSSTATTTTSEPFRPWNTESHHHHHHQHHHHHHHINASSQVAIGAANFVMPQPPQLPPPQVLLLQSPDYGPPLKSYVRPSSPFDTKPQILVNRSPSPTEPLSLVKKTDESILNKERRETKTDPNNVISKIKLEYNPPTNSDSCDPINLRVPIHPHFATLSTAEAERLLVNSAEAFPNLQPHQQQLHPKNCNAEEEQELQQGCGGRKEQRNYKNMTRERRIEANARERTRVHTISAAFDTLRRSVPSYSHNQKLSKLSVLRIACSYIMTLSTLVGGASGIETDSSLSSNLSDCVDTVSKTIQKEGKLRKKKEDSE